jgi:hypothetical protein
MLTNITISIMWLYFTFTKLVNLVFSLILHLNIPAAIFFVFIGHFLSQKAQIFLISLWVVQSFELVSRHSIHSYLRRATTLRIVRST